MHAHPSGSANHRAQRRAMKWSLGVGLAMFAGKGLAYVLTGSAAVLSDATESVVHVVAVAFAAYSLWLSQQPPDREHLYGHEKVGFFSAGFEGAMIVLAGLFIILEAVRKWLAGLAIEHLDAGLLLVVLATVVNGILGLYLVQVGRRERSLILVANGKHVLTDGVTSLGVIVALLLVRVTGRLEFDPILAIVVAVQILWTGGQLMRQSFRGLMDASDPEVDRLLRSVLDTWSATSGGQYHGLRHRSAGDVLWAEVHLLLPGNQNLQTAHAAATVVEDQIEQAFPRLRVMVTTHLEPLELHADHHPSGGLQHTVVGPS